MTHDRRAALLLKMNDVYWAAEEGTKVTPLDRMSDVLDLIRAEVLEEAAKVADENLAWDTAADLRALKGGT